MYVIGFTSFLAFNYSEVALLITHKLLYKEDINRLDYLKNRYI